MMVKSLVDNEDWMPKEKIEVECIDHLFLQEIELDLYVMIKNFVHSWKEEDDVRSPHPFNERITTKQMTRSQIYKSKSKCYF